jgi:hypothetical protein
MTHADWCRLSQAFNESASLWTDQDRRINEWLKEGIAKAKRREASDEQSFKDLRDSGGIADAP